MPLLALAPTAGLPEWLQFLAQNFFGVVGAFTAVWTLILLIAYIPARRKVEAMAAQDAAQRRRTIDDLEKRKQKLATDLADLAERRTEARFHELIEEAAWLSDRVDQLADTMANSGIAVPLPSRPRPILRRTNRIMREIGMQPPPETDEDGDHAPSE